MWELGVDTGSGRGNQSFHTKRKGHSGNANQFLCHRSNGVAERVKCFRNFRFHLQRRKTSPQPFLFFVLSRWPRTCALSCSQRATSSRTPKGSASSTLGTERTTSSRSFTEPSWSDLGALCDLCDLAPATSNSGYIFITFGWDCK